MSESGKYNILFVCTGNTCRSPMAEYAMRMLLEKDRPGKTVVSSAGIAAADGFPATQYSAEAGRMWDLDLTKHRSRLLSKEMIEQADLIFAMAPEHHREIVRLDSSAADRTYLLKNFPDDSPDGEDVEDPIGLSLDFYNQTFLDVGECLGKYLPEIIERIDGGTDA